MGEQDRLTLVRIIYNKHLKEIIFLGLLSLLLVFVLYGTEGQLYPTNISVVNQQGTTVGVADMCEGRSLMCVEVGRVRERNRS